MENMRLAKIRLPNDLIAALDRAARAAGTSPQDFIRDTLRRDLGLLGAPGRDAPPGALPAAVRAAFAEAHGWLSLQARLRSLGFVLRPAEDGRLRLHSWPANHPLIDCDAIGFHAADLTLRFRAPFPGQPPRRTGPTPGDTGAQVA